MAVFVLYLLAGPFLVVPVRGLGRGYPQLNLEGRSLGTRQLGHQIDRGRANSADYRPQD